MKRPILFFALITLFSCQEKSNPDRIPLSQSKFTEVVKTIRNNIDHAPDEQVRRQILGIGVDSIKQYIKDSLQLEFGSWNARVLTLTDNYDYSDRIDIRLGINIDPEPMSEKTRYKSVVFRDIIDKSASGIAPEVQTLSVGDIVLISGTFVSKNGMIDMGSFNDYKISKNLFANPQFLVELREISKQ